MSFCLKPDFLNPWYGVLQLSAQTTHIHTWLYFAYSCDSSQQQEGKNTTEWQRFQVAGAPIFLPITFTLPHKNRLRQTIRLDRMRRCRNTVVRCWGFPPLPSHLVQIHLYIIYLCNLLKLLGFKLRGQSMMVLDLKETFFPFMSSPNVWTVWNFSI